MEDVFNRSFVGSKDFSSIVNSSDSKILKSEFITLEEKNEVEECRIIGKTETDHLRELEEARLQTFRERENLSRKKDQHKDNLIMWIDFGSEVKESVAENAAFGKTFTKPLKFEDNVENRDNFIMSAENSMEYRNNSALDEEEEQYEEDDNWEKFRLPDILHDTQEIKSDLFDRRLKTITEELELTSSTLSTPDLNQTVILAKDDDDDNNDVIVPFSYDKGRETLEFENLEKKIQSEEQYTIHHDKGNETLEFENLEKKLNINLDVEDDDNIWHIDDDGKTHIDTFQNGDLYSWLESERYRLERLLGQEKLFAAYKIVSDLDDDDECAWNKILTLVGQKRESMVDRIIQFVVADSFYIYAN